MSSRTAAEVLLITFVVTASVAFAADCNTVSNKTYPPNNNPISTGAPIFVRAVPNGELYTVGTAGLNEIFLLHVYGSNGYDWGYAAGQLLPYEMNQTLTTAWNYFVTQIMNQVNGIAKKYNIPSWLEQLIVDKGLEAVLDWQHEESKKFVDPQVYAEMRGIADATGISYDMIRRIHYIGEVTRGQCSLYGAWGDQTLGGKTLQLRALDWDTGAGLQNFPAVTVYHPADPSQGVPFANVGWAGWIGTLSGMSSNRLGISEIGVSYPNYAPHFGNESFIGIPFVFLERQILQFGSSVFNAMDIISNATRTCDLILGVGDGNAKTARMVQYSHSVVRFFDDQDLEPLAWWHPRINQTVYSGMDWFCPFYQHSLFNQLTYARGQLTPELSIQNVTAVVGTGDLHAAVYDLTDLQLFVGNARGANMTTGGFKAYERAFVKIDLASSFQKPFGHRH